MVIFESLSAAERGVWRRIGFDLASRYGRERASARIGLTNDRWPWRLLLCRLVEMAKPALDLTKLTPEQKLELIDELWSSITPEEFPLTEEQRTELHRRLDRLDEEGLVGVSWESVRLEMTRRS